MRALQLSNKPIYPLLDGGCIAMNELSKLLCANFDTVKSISISTEKHPFDLTSFPEDVQQQLQPESFAISTSISAVGAMKSLLTGTSYNLVRFYDKDFENFLIQHLTSNTYDFIFCESIYVLPYLATLRNHSKAKIVVRTHNVEHQIWQRLAHEATFPKSWYLKRLSKSLKNEELQLLQKVDGILTISEEDKQTFNSLGIQTPMEIIPVTMELSEEKVTGASNHFHHLGSMNWQPNIEAVDALITTLFPKIRMQLPTAELHLAGSYFPETLKSNASKGIYVHGFVEDRFQFINQHGIQLIPLKSGSGVRIKLLESMANGTPIVVTPIGAEGIELLQDESFLVANNDEEFVHHAVELYKNADLRKKIGTNARALIEKNYSFGGINKRFIAFIKTIS